LIQVHISPGEHRIALLRNADVIAFFVHRPASPDGLGDLHVARLLTHLPALAGSFVALHDAEAFLPDSENPGRATAGTHLPVRITRAAQAGKGPRVTARIADPPRDIGAPVRLLARGPSVLHELQAAYPDEPVLHAPFDDALEARIEALARPEAVLPGGVRASFSPTPALTAIDLDSAGASAARAPKAAAQMGANLAALPGLVREIVLRNLSGAILIDFAGVPSRKRRALEPALVAALAADRLRPTLAGFSHLGFAELSRPRLRPPLHEMVGSPMGIGLAALRQVGREAAAGPARRLALRAAPAVINALRAGGEAVAELDRLMTYPLVCVSDPALTRTWLIEDARD
jgi:Ribonuclease G/E